MPGAYVPVREPEMEAILVEHVEDEVDNPWLTAPLVEATVLEDPPRDVAEVPVIEPPVEAPVVDDAQRDVVEEPVAELSSEVPVVQHGQRGRPVVTVTEITVKSELSPEAGPPAPEMVVDLTVESGPEDGSAHSADCGCLACRWGHFEPATSATEPAAALHSFYCDVVRQVLQELSHPATEPSPRVDMTGAPHSETISRRRRLLHRDRR
jgi:hypothetical protein